MTELFEKVSLMGGLLLLEGSLELLQKDLSEIMDFVDAAEVIHHDVNGSDTHSPFNQKWLNDMHAIVSKWQEFLVTGEDK